MIPNVLALWPLVRWILQALGLKGPEDVEQERAWKLKLMEATERKDAAMVQAFASFQGLWRPSAERVYVWANTAIALFQPTILGLIYYDVIWGQRRSIQAAVDLEKAGIPGLFIMAIMLFPFYGPALVSGVSAAFGSAVDLVAKRKDGGVVKAPVEKAPVVSPGETELERLSRLSRERNDAIIRGREVARPPVGSMDPDENDVGLDR